MKVDYIKLNSFAKTEYGGNEAGVVINADSFTEMQMKAIANRLAFSETAFIMRSDVADFKIMFFTPKDEVELCGHATIGAFYALAKEKLIEPGKYTQETKAGILKVEILEDLSIMMNQNLPVFSETVDKAELAESLKLKSEDICECLPAQIVSTGLPDIIIPIKKLSVLESIKPDFERIIQISKKYSVVGYHVFTEETLARATAACRNFAPLYDIPEESATGTSSGALGCYLYKYGRVNSETALRMHFEQGYFMRKPSEIIASLTISNDKIQEVKVGGKALKLVKQSIEIITPLELY